MKHSVLSMMLLAASLFTLMSCNKTDYISPDKENEVENLKLIKTFSDNGFKVELFKSSGQLVVGYNKIFLRLTDKSGNYISNASVNWLPMMTMNMNGMIKSHSCPFSGITKTANKQTLFEGYIVFVMASNEPGDSWNLKINFTAGGQTIDINDKVNVVSTISQFQKLYTSVTGNDGMTYMLAFVEPANPRVGINDFVAGLFYKGENGDFPIAGNYKIKVDSRMPGMGNHSAMGNEDMIQGSDGLYHGKVGFSMTGSWVINMILQNSSGEVVKGESITETNPESSLNFKLEF
ncbi:MAG: FixH family protein [Chitinophagaceae bacterium]|nr:FixH family protein [Chitinophagaceae bacterium]